MASSQDDAAVKTETKQAFQVEHADLCPICGARLNHEHQTECPACGTKLCWTCNCKYV